MGEIRVILLNTSKSETFGISQGDRIAQLIFEFTFFPFTPSQDPDSEQTRGDGGFGSTGK